MIYGRLCKSMTIFLVPETWTEEALPRQRNGGDMLPPIRMLWPLMPCVHQSRLQHGNERQERLQTATASLD